MKRKLSLLLSIVLILSLSVTSFGLTVTAVKNIALNSGSVAVKVGNTFSLKVNVTPVNASKRVTFMSDNKNIATVDKNGNIKGISVGKTVITVTSAATKAVTAKCYVTVTKPIKLTMWTFKLAYVEGFQAVANQFEKNTGISVKVQAFTPDAAYQQKVKAATSAGGLPDIIQWWAAAGSSGGAFIDLSKKMNDNVKKSFFKGSLEAVTVTAQNVKDAKENKDASTYEKAQKAGQFFAVPLDVGGFYTFFGNKKILKEAGLTAKVPKTWEEFVSMMKTVKAKTNKTPLVFGAKVGPVWTTWCQNGIEIMLNGEGGYQALLERKDKMSDPKHVKVLQVIEGLSKNGLLAPGILNIDIDGADQQFAAGKAAFNLGGSFTMSSLAAMGMKSDDMYAFPVPALAGSKITSWTANPFALTELAVSSQSNTDKQNAAIEYLKFISSKEGAVLFSNKAFTVSAVDLGDYADKLNDSVKNMTKSFASGETPMSRIPSAVQGYVWAHAEWRTLETSIQQIIDGNKTAVQAAEDFDEAMKQEVKANK